jgi:hypothetical protein
MDYQACISCNKTQSLESYYKHSGMANGHLSKCKECCKRDNRLNREKNLKRYRMYDRKRFHENKERREYSYKKSREHRIKFPKKNKARQAVSNAIRDKRLTRKPCQICGSMQVEAHHEDYNKPLDVIWLCSGHHGDLHRGAISVEQLS